MLYSRLQRKYFSLKIIESKGFPGGPVVKMSPFDAEAFRFNPWSRNQDPTSLVARVPKKHKTEIIL